MTPEQLETRLFELMAMTTPTADTEHAKASFEGWVILELMGHRRLAGYLSEEVVGGTAFLRIDVPGQDTTISATQFYSGSAVYCITPTTEEIARKVAASSQPAPVTAWDLRPERALPARPHDEDAEID
jgi:hypothetical protein